MEGGVWQPFRLKHQSDLLDVLCGGGEQALLLDSCQAAHSGVAVSVQLFGVGEASLHRLFSAFVDALAHAVPAGVRSIRSRLASHTCRVTTLVRCGCGALVPHRAVAALVRIGVVLPIAFAVGRAVDQQLSVGADIDIELFVVVILAFVELAFAMGWSAVADHSVDVALFQPLAIAAAA